MIQLTVSEFENWFSKSIHSWSKNSWIKKVHPQVNLLHPNPLLSMLSRVAITHPKVYQYLETLWLLPISSRRTI